MTDTVTVGQELQGQILDAVRKSQDMAIEAIKTFTDAVAPMTSALPPVTLPMVGKLPRPEEFVGSAYNFAEQLLASQRKFAESVLEVTSSAAAKKTGPPASASKTHSPAK